MSYDQRLDITHLIPFATELSTTIFAQPNKRLNNMAMLRALNAKPMAEIVNLEKAAEATTAYLAVLNVLTRVRLQIVPDDEVEDLDNLKLTYDRFKVGLSTVKHHLLILNS